VLNGAIKSALSVLLDHTSIETVSVKLSIPFAQHLTA
jgi:hypothetical protein